MIFRNLHTEKPDATLDFSAEHVFAARGEEGAARFTMIVARGAYRLSVPGGAGQTLR
jgi:hypothetical protein